MLNKLLLERSFSIQPEALSWPGTTSTTSPLLCGGLADGADEQRLDTDSRVIDFLLAEAWVDDINDTCDIQSVWLASRNKR